MAAALVVTAPVRAGMPQVQAKVLRVQAATPAWIRSGGDGSRIEPLRREVERAMSVGDLAAAERALDGILALVESRVDAPRSAPGEAPPRDAALRGTPRKVRLAGVPASMDVVFHRDGLIFVGDTISGRTEQLTFAPSRAIEHVAMSADRRRVVASYHPDRPEAPGSSRLILFDLEAGTECDLVPGFETAGNGGVDWDSQGYVYFAGVERRPYPSPHSLREHIANAGANDVYKVHADGRDLVRLTRTPDRGEADVSVSEDGTLVAFMATHVDPPRDPTGIWICGSDGRNLHQVVAAGRNGVDSVHDPELSPDNRRVIYSRVNPAFRNFPRDPHANTAHDLWSVARDGSDSVRHTDPGPISIVPDWSGDRILFLLLTDRTDPPFLGLAVMAGPGSAVERLPFRANIGKWIPRPASPAPVDPR